MRTLSHRTATIVASALSLLVLAFPARSFAAPSWCGHRGWGYDTEYARPYDDEGQGERHWRETQHEREGLFPAWDAQRRNWYQLQHERRELGQQQWGFHHHHDGDED